MNKESTSNDHAIIVWLSSIQYWSYASRFKFIKVFSIIGVLFFSAFIAHFFPLKYLILSIALITAIGGLVIFLKNPVIGLIVLIVAGMLLNFEIGTSTNTSLNLVIILLPVFIGIWFFDQLIRKREFHFVSSRANPPLITLVLVTIFAFGIGQLTWFYYARQAPLMSQLGGMAIFILSAGAFIFTANVITSIKWLKILTWMFVGLSTLFILARVNPVFGSYLSGILPAGTTGSLFWLWLIAIAYSQLLFNNDLKIYWRLALLGLVAATLFVAMYLGYGWKSGWIPPLVAIGVITWLRFRRLRYLLTIGGIILIWLIASELIQSDQYSYVTRIEAWKIILNEIIRVNPIFGLGPANYRFYTPLFPIMGYWVEFNSHNNYIDIIAQIGVLGLIAFLWFAWEVSRLGWGLLKKNLGGFSNAYVVGAMGGLVGMLIAGMLGDWVIPFVYNVGLKGFRASVLGWIFLGGLAAIQHIQAINEDDVGQGTE